PVRDRQVKEFLMSNLHVPDYKADILTSFAQGNVGKAIEAARSPEFEEMTEKAIQILKSYGNRNVGEVLDVVRMMSDDKQNINEYLEFFSMWFRDVLMFKATREVDSLIFKDEINAIRSRASVSSYEGLEKILEAIEKAEQRLRANVNFDLVMELLFLTIREN
ncbi:MAG TPA: DNA polymerase III subunit delta, partial [Lachnospiraceae bacterium]|nr:DNA polymerase III subunit delta [Lachnospiraceae bacterium]